MFSRAQRKLSIGEGFVCCAVCPAKTAKFTALVRIIDKAMACETFHVPRWENKIA